MRTRLDVLLVACGLLAVLPAEAQPDAGESPAERGDWEMEVLRRHDGKVFHGLLWAEREDEIEFIEVARPPGKPLFLVIHFYHPRLVASVTRLVARQRPILLEQIKPLLENKNQARIEAGRMEDVELTQVVRNGTRYYSYAGNLLTLLSTADPETTRRCAVRIDQIFRAYRHLLPPRRQRDDELVVLLLGSMDEYRGELHRRNLQVTNPAVFFTEQNLIAAGSELTRFSVHLQRLRGQSDRRREEYEALDKDLPSRLNNLAAEMKRRGFNAGEIKFEVAARKAAWLREYNSALEKIAEVNRRNEEKFRDVTRQMFTRLYHEAFHAYLENYVYSHNKYDVPRWLNEGLAQVFESGQLYNDRLRVDAPDRALLDGLKADLTSGRPLTLANLLAADNERFLVAHEDANVSQRHYLYAWGLAYYLTFREDLLEHEALDKYVSRETAKLLPVERFEKLVGMPLTAFEHKWRQAMLKLSHY